MADDIEVRIRERAHKMWLEDGCPEGKADSHWSLAKMAIAMEDSRSQMLRPIESSESDPRETWVNEAEFPTLTDQGEQSPPGELADPDA
jgi:hypothetical protein